MDTRKLTFKGVALRVLGGIACAVPAMHAVLSLGMIGVNEVLWTAAALPVVFALLGFKRSILIAGSLFLVTLVLGFGVRVSGLYDHIFYRPMEAMTAYDFSRDTLVFRKNAAMNMTVPYGDLNAMLKEKVQPVPQPMGFATDSLGYRNDEDFSDQEVVVVGDSFIVGHGNDQPDILANRLARNHGIRAYGAAYPGDMIDYAGYIKDFTARHGRDRCMVLFFFEGNDFGSVKDRDRGKSGLWLLAKKVRDYYRDTALGRYLFVLKRRLSAKGGKPDVAFRDVNGTMVGYLGSEKGLVFRERYEGSPDFERSFAAVADDLCHVFFIPVKYRVYREVLDPEETRPSGDAQWNYLRGLAHRYGVPATDLTPALGAEAARGLDQGWFVWWPDDSHWNGRGIAVAADKVAGLLDGRRDAPSP